MHTNIMNYIIGFMPIKINNKNIRNVYDISLQYCLYIKYKYTFLYVTDGRILGFLTSRNGVLEK